VRQTKWSGKTAGDKRSDGGGLYLHVTKAGKYWRMAYRFAGKQKLLAIGVYPAVSLAQARKKRDQAREQLAQGIDPSATKQIEKAAMVEAGESTFETVARELHAIKVKGWSPQYGDRWIERMEKDLFPALGRVPLASLTGPMVLAALRRVEARGALETAHTLRQTAGQVFRYGVQTGRCERNPVVDLQGALKPQVVKHMAAILEPVDAGGLLRAFDGYKGQPTTKAALQLSALLFQRPGNIRAMEWAWIDLDAAMLTIPSAAMKRTVAQKLNGRPHFVPLAHQAVAILRELQPLTGHGRYVFSSLRTASRPMSENTVNAALRRMGFTGDEMTAHGFRSMARTLMAEQLEGVHPDVVEAQLAHGKSGPLGAAYDRAEYMAQRRKMMQTWADYLDKLRQGADVVEFQAA
jgi:integrase